MTRPGLPLALAAMLGVFGAPAPAAAAPETSSSIVLQNNLPLESLTVTVFRDTRARGLLAVDLSLELARPNDRGKIEKIMPRLRDRYLTALTRFAANRIDVNRTVDLGALARLLQGVTDEVLGQKAATILIGGATVRRL